MPLASRYRLHRKDLTGKPDLVFGPRLKVTFVNGCFWHGHDCALGARHPKANVAYCRAKIARNVERDAANETALKVGSWCVLTVWECQTKIGDRPDLERTLREFLG
jgi:DNA mismatch endonuclease (patch repair protein)